MKKVIPQKKLIRKRWLHRRPIYFGVRIVANGVYPELDRNSGNFFAQMAEKDREDEFVGILGLLWAETGRGGSKVSSQPSKES